MTTKPCTCDGTNENCSRCFGTGSITVGLYPVAYPIVTTRLVRKRKQARVIAPPRHGSYRIVSAQVQCLICREMLPAGRLGLHYSARHSGAHNLITRKQRATLVVCPVCQLTVKKLAKHMRSHDISTPTVGSQGKQPTERERLIKLGVIVPARDGNKSDTTVNRHAQKSSKKRASKIEVEGRAGALDRWKEELESNQNPNWPKNLDYTRPYAHAYRETGRFGSHPSHDGFDDESGA